MEKVSLGYPGGKTMISDWILQFFPPHTCYVEPFGGGASLLLLKKPSEVEVYNDKDDLLVNMFRVIKNPEKSQILFKNLKNTLYSRSEHRRAVSIIRNPRLAQDDVELAWATYVALYFCYGSKLNSGFRYSNVKNNTRRYFNSLRNIVYIRQRFSNVIVENLDWYDCVLRYDGPETLFYIDPPYWGANTQHYRVGDIFRRDLSLHEDIAIKLSNVKGMVLLSSYENPAYEKYLKDWHREYLKTKTFLINSNVIENPEKDRTEILWINPNAWEKLKTKMVKLWDEP